MVANEPIEVQLRSCARSLAKLLLEELQSVIENEQLKKPHVTGKSETRLPGLAATQQISGIPPIAGEQNAALLVTPREVATLLSMSEKTIWRMTKDGQMPCVRVGKLVRYSPKALAAWIDAKNSTVKECENLEDSE